MLARAAYSERACLSVYVLVLRAQCYGKVMMTRGFHADPSSARDISSRLKVLESAYVAMQLQLESSRQERSYSNVTQLGRRIQAMPSFQAAVPATDLFPPPTAEQWRLFFRALGLPEQPDDADWVGLLSPLELAAREKHQLGDSLRYASSATFTAFKNSLEDKMQLGVGFILRALESADMTELYWRDTSRCGIRNSVHKPDFTGFVMPTEVPSSVVRSAALQL